MSFRFRPSESVQANVRRMARDRLDDAIDDLRAAARGEDLHGNVHEARKRGKHVRSLTRLVRASAPELHDEVNAAVRDAARLLSDLRDREAVVETLDDLVEHEAADEVASAASAVRPHLVARRDDGARTAEPDVEEALVRFVDVREGVGDWAVPEGVEALAGGFAKTYRRARKRYEEVHADATTALLHEWRKRVKYHRYHLRMLEPVWPAGFGARLDEVHHLSDLLGDDHDLAVLRGVLEAHGDVDPAEGRALVTVLDRRRAELQQAALPLGARLFATDDDAMVDLLVSCWHAWTAEAAAPDLPRALALAPAD